MVKLEANNKMFFDTDDDFYKFCVCPKLVICQEVNPTTGEIEHYTDFEFTNDYISAVNKGIKFMICDDNSQIFKRGCVSYRTITKPVSNLCQYNKIYYNKIYGNQELASK
jgi:hypothetical protein